ncbi:protein artichoke [Folsomia candida]|uniref:protein artichoke n=1 Tax=Folsomia candida TaxID=158441 RepID=UPI001604CC03|nr:protein artichoke [Folsomia candida]
MAKFCGVFAFVALLFVTTIHGEIVCPAYQEIPFCSCFVLDDQLHIQCSGSDIPALKKSLQVLNGPVKSYSVYDLDSRAAILPDGVTDNVTSPVYHLQISHSSLEDLAENSLRGLSKSLESLAIVSSRLKFIPQTTLSTLRRLKILDFEGNQVQELGPYSFHNILLQKLNLKGNLLENVSEHAFWGLEETLMDVDMSENKLKTVPFPALRRLHLLSSLSLAWNELTDLAALLPPTLPPPPPAEPSRSKKSGAFDVIRNSLKAGTPPNNLLPANNAPHHPTTTSMDWPLLKYLNLNSNYLRSLHRGTFNSMRNLRTVSIHLNSIEVIDPATFFPLVELESIDLSHNKLSLLPSPTFQENVKLVSIDLSNNHLHSIGEGLFQNLFELRELFLNGNNIIQLTSPTFLGSPQISILYLQGNAVKYLESGIFFPLKNLTEVRLSDNFLRILPQDVFLRNEHLTSVSLDGNLLGKVVPGTFQTCRGLRELRLQNNEITTIPAGVLEGLETLEEVHLENNRLNGIKGLDNLRRIRHVTLSRNSFEKVTADMLPGTELSSLSLGHNNIKGISDGAFANQTTLSLLYLGNNRLTRLGQRAFSGLRSLERLYLQRNNISWIHGDAFSSQTKALQYLDLSFNQLKTINRAIFSGLAFIEEINLSHNDISTLEDGSFSNLRSLRILDLSTNRIQSLHYASTFHPAGLEILKICCNTLSELLIGIPATSSSSSLSSGETGSLTSPRFQSPPIALKELDLQQNDLTGSVVRQLNLGRLEVLQISGNNLTDMDENMLDGFPSLNFFSAEKSHITSLPGNVFKLNLNLAVIRLSDNFISHIPDSVFIPAGIGGGQAGAGVSPLRELHLRHNRLRAFPYKALGNSTLLEVLTLSGNRINTLDLNRIMLPRIKQLDMNDNRLTKIMGGSMTKSTPLLQVVDFGENNISRVSDDLVRNVSLTQINFGGNSLQKVPFAFSERFVTSAFVLNMSGNPLINFYTENHPSRNFSVMDLYLCETNVSFLTSEEFKIYPRLHRLVIKRNPLTLLPPAGFSSLQNLNLLDLSENAIEDLKHDSFIGLVTLKSLNLSHNSIKTLQPFHPHLAGLQDLDLSFNQLSRLSPETFANLISLVTLRIRGNWLTGLPAELFGPLARLAVLDLSHNFIESVPSTVLRHLETRISTLKLEENPLNCDCDSKELWEWLQTHPKAFSQPGSPIASALAAGGVGVPNSRTPSDGTQLQPNFICERPDEFRGRGILDLDLDSFCSSPAIVKLAIQDVQPSSAIISWQGRNNSAMQGYMIGYHALNHDDQIRWTRPLPAVSKAYRIPDLESDTPYLVCVLGLAQDTTSNVTTSALTLLSAETVLRDSPVSKCTKVRTSISVSGSDKFSILQRRMGVIVGAAVGVVVFIVLMTILTCVKLKKSRRAGATREEENGKSDHHNNHLGVTEALTPPNGTNGLGTLNYGHNTLQFHNGHTHTLTRMGNGNGNSAVVTSPNRGGRMSPEFLTYRHYSIATDNNGVNIMQSMATTDLDRL